MLKHHTGGEIRPNSALLKNKSNIDFGNMIAGHFPGALRPGDQ
jgi:hypothetical protein